MDKLVTLEIKHTEMETKQFKTEEKVVELQWRGMRENLIFKGIHEPKLMQGEFEIVELTLKNFLRNEMNITTDIPLDRVHRMGRYRPEQSFPRPIVAKFERYKDKELVRSAAPKTLVGKPYGVNEQFPAEIENKRKLLYPEAKKARRNKNNKVRFIRDKLFVNDREITVEDVGTSNFQPSHAYKTNENRNKDVIYESRSSRGRGQNRGRGQSSRGQRSNQWSTQRKSNLNSNLDNWHSDNSQTRQSAWETPKVAVNNRFETLSSLNNEETPVRVSGKHQASSPLDADINLKKHREDNVTENLHGQVHERAAIPFPNENQSAHEPMDSYCIDIENSENSQPERPIVSSIADEQCEAATTAGISHAAQNSPLQMPQSVSDSSLLYYGSSVSTNTVTNNTQTNTATHEVCPQVVNTDDTISGNHE